MMLKSRLVLIFVVLSFLLYSIIIIIPLSAAPKPKRSPLPPPSSPPPPAPAFDFFVLALQWPPSFCAVEPCGQGVASKFQEFKLHGLWPSNYIGAQPRNCQPHILIDWSINSKMAPLMTQLEANWPDLKMSIPAPLGSYTSFWDTQWRKHGNCSTMEEYGYFSEAVLKNQFHANRDLLVILQSDMKTRPGVNPIQSIDVFNAISAPTGIGKEPQIICRTSKKKSYIVEVRLCLDTSKVISRSMENKYIKCPSLPPTKLCPPTVYLPY